MSSSKLKQNYECPRCGIYSERKSVIRDHLTKRKKTCPATKENIDLTPEIIEYILVNRIYKKAPDPVTTLANSSPMALALVGNQSANNINNMNQLINQYNHTHNFVINIDPLTKINELQKYLGKETLDFDSHVEDTYDDMSNKLRTNDIRHGNVQFDESNFINMVNTISKSKMQDLEDMCVFFHTEDKQLFISRGEGTWEDKSVDEGLDIIVRTLADYYLDHYEKYLIRKLESVSGGKLRQEHAGLLDSLKDYYRFICAFRVQSCTVGKNDTQILYNDEDPEYNEDIPPHELDKHILVDKYGKLYSDIANATTKSQIKMLRKKVLEGVNTMTKKNMRELNRRVMDIISMDEGFQKNLLMNRE
jgi:hypothetical protein